MTLYTHEAPKDARWIRTQDANQYTGCFRKEIDLPSDVRYAWLSVVSEGGFELLCNGDSVGAQMYWRPTRAFQNGLTESGQRVTNNEPMVAYNFPREYQWSGHNNTKITTVFDLRPYLRKGKNTICLESEGRLPQPAVLAFGEIGLRHGERVSVVTDNTWMAEPVPREVKQGGWSLPTVDTRHWKKAEIKPRPVVPFLSCVPTTLYRKPFDSRWVVARAPDGDDAQSHEFTADFQLSDPQAAWLQLLSHGNYWIWVNGRSLGVSRSKAKAYHGGDWLVRWEGRRPLATPPILLDPDEVSFFGGYRFETPRHGDPTKNDFKRYENQLNRTKERPKGTGGDSHAGEDEERGRLQDPYGFLEEANIAVPHALLRQRAKAKLQAYDISHLVVPGKNQIHVRLVADPALGYRGSQAIKFALDGAVHEHHGQDVALSHLSWNRVVDGGHAMAVSGRQVTPDELPAMKFMGGAPRTLSRWWWAVLACPMVVLIVMRHRIGWLRQSAMIFSGLLLVAMFFQISYAERSEMLWFMSPAWRYGAVIGALLIACLLRFFQGGRPRLLSCGLPCWLCPVILLAVFLLRAWMVEHQPIDDDEYASIQAVLSIAETGKPSLAGEIWYSRSPLYHYAAAAVVKVFGANIWSLRLYSVLLSVLTGWVLWLLARRYFRDPWVAGAALLIFALHPFLIFSGHIARFYQQQQLMVLLMIHLFIQGFIYTKSIKHRVAAIVVFALAVLSQEISISFVPVLLIAYLLFGRGTPLKWEVKSMVYLVFAGLLIVADVLLFKVKCITTSVGVSPNVEATLAPTFWELGNLFSMFVGYSRLHLVLSVFYMMSLVYSIRRGSSRLITLHVFLIVSVVAFNLIITSVSFRYMYSIIPLWILLGVHGVSVFSLWLSVQINRRTGNALRWLFLLVVVLSMAPWRIMQSYQEKILGDPISSLAYVKSEMRPEDKIMITEPHPHAAKIELGRVDYDLVVPILYDFTYNSEGVLRDRNAGAMAVNRLADLQKIFSEQPRVWVILNREKFRSRKKNIRWEYPGAREELFIRQNAELKYRSYLWSVYLWDRSAGAMETFRKEPDGWVE
ncbi:MAG: glycosyltransferase family 39 protein [Verrucomicrobiae bacterium]|nr:glycosyltransferase family 39 protein [Verrucomicrobiae bacterium]NNJ43590.1 hypothetical protein [Akkermansiaceae bacterium]